MRKRFFISLAITSLFILFSCEKEVEISSIPCDNNGEYEIVITGHLDKELTRTSYDSEGKMTWLNTDKIALVVNNNGTVSDQNRYQLDVASITNEGRTATFSTLVDKHQAASGWTSSGFAVYPTAISQIKSDSGYDRPFVKMPYNVNGLLSSAILVGTPNNDTPAQVTNFLFKTATSILKITLNNIPANTAELRLCTNDGGSYPVDGDFSLIKDDGVVTIGNSNYLGSGKSYQSISITDGVEIASRSFYYNVPVADYPAGTLYIQLRDANGGQIMKRTINRKLKLARNECVSLPEIEISNEVTIGGSVQTPRVVWSIDSKQFRFAVNQNASLVLSEFPDSYRFSNGGDGRYTSSGSGYPYGYAMSALSPVPVSSSGLYYLHYVILSSTTKPSTVSDANVVKYGSIPFYYLNSSDATNLVGSYTATQNNANWFGSSAHNAVVKIVASSDITKGCVALTHFLGRSYDLTEMSGGMDDRNIAGSPVYGVISENTLTFKNVSTDGSEGYFFTDYLSEPFIISGGDDGVAVGSGEVSAASDTNDFSYSIDTTDGTVLSNSGLIVLKFLYRSNNSWTRFWTVQNQKLTKN